ncbi:MAG: carbon-nitrogen hydrolase family protein [Firmicutes bacterium]|nr:carbon-nitrogen hydrolase family protein [Bacillota bacterium]
MDAAVESEVRLPGGPVVAAVVQVQAGTEKEQNIEKAEGFVREAAKAGAQIIGLPENFAYVGPWAEGLEKGIDEPIPGPTTDRLADLCKRMGIYLLAGSLPERVENGDGVLHYSTSVLIDPDGKILARYRKMHLFDVEIPGQVRAKESDRFAYGDRIVTADSPLGRMGLSICYDVRFAELYRTLARAGAWCVWVPANFTLYTGKDHWEVLLRARAIENQYFVLAPNQIGPHRTEHGQGRSFGSAMIVDPWGTVIARMPEEEGFVLARLDPDRVRKVRTVLPAWRHHRPEQLYR